MKKIITLFILILLCVSAFSPVVLAQTDRRIDAIKKLVQKIDEDIARSDAEPEYSNIYLTELAVNKGNGSYPAVGIYRPVVKFYYTYGDREKDPYPNRLLKIIVSIDRSDRHEQSEFIFNEAEQLIYYFEKKDDVERRLYFAAGHAIRFQEGQRVLSLTAKSQSDVVATVLRDKTNLVTIFRRSLGF
ncbi:MAG: hypothetical protein ACXW3C_09580 [Pyrinomonadaceae bacterium]